MADNSSGNGSSGDSVTALFSASNAAPGMPLTNDMNNLMAQSLMANAAGSAGDFPANQQLNQAQSTLVDPNTLIASQAPVQDPMMAALFSNLFGD